jgi:hypothetical protein
MMHDGYGHDDDQDETSIDDVASVRAILVAAATAREDRTYGQVLRRLGHRFTRPKMRMLCRTIDAIDKAGRAAGEPELAALVVRESDRLPGQGWWVGKMRRLGYEGAWTGPDTVAFVGDQQKLAFDYWSK